MLTDPGLLRSVMQNFVTNAVRYTPEGGILIGVRRRGDEWRIDVVDTGVGIEPGQLGAVFGEFTRLGQVEVEGLGLGLALVERITRLLGGRVDVASNPGQGSRFSLILPALEGVAVTAPNAGEPAAHGAGRALTVLVIDNDERIVEASMALLNGLGHHPLGGATIADGLALCEHADVLLADYQLDHGENGLDLIAAVRQRRPALPALLVTAENGAAMKARAAALGVPIMAKPVNPQVLARTLGEVSVPQIKP